MLEKYKDKKILIAGFGVEGKATFAFLKKHGILADIADVHTPVIPARQRSGKHPARIQKNTLKIVTGKDYLSSAQDYDVVFHTPGISPLTPALQSASQKGTEITSQIKLFMDLCPCKTIGVTGTKGKGTTASLIYEILKASGKDVYLGGNIGMPAISFLEKLNKDSIVVLELSSFQLMDLGKSPNIAVVLNITQDHLDYHKDREEYVEAKKSIVKYQTENDFAVINMDYETSKGFAKETKAEIWGVSTLPVIPSPPAERINSAEGSFSNERKGFLHVRSDGHRSVGRNDKTEKRCYVNGNEEVIMCTKDTDEKVALFPELQLRGRHNLENVCAAVAVSYVAGADLDSIKKTVKGFKGLEHRLEFMAEIDGVKYYNDSFATTPETTIAAIKSFHEPIILIAGGSKKGSDYTQMGKVIAEKAKTVFLIGETAEEIKEKIVGVNPAMDIQEGFTDMNNLVKRAKDAAEPGDVVVLSPGCASFGLFENYKQRGELFKEAVKNLESGI